MDSKLTVHCTDFTYGVFHIVANFLQTDMHDGFMLNIDQLYLEKSKPKRSAQLVSQDLAKHMMAIVDKYAAYTGKGGLSFATVANSPEYAEFMGIAHELQKVF